MSSDSHAVKTFKLEFNACTDKLAKFLKTQGWHGVIVAWHPEHEEAWLVTQTVGSNDAELEQARNVLGKSLGGENEQP